MQVHEPAPVRLLIGSFLGLILTGTLLLKLPAATPPGQPITWIDALFTAASAACVTGLAVRDTGTGFTLFGQLVILGLFQAGGLGVMTFSLFILALFRGRFSQSQRYLFEQTLGGSGRAQVWPVLRLVIFFTFITEAAGALLLFARWLPEMGAAPGAYHAVFHAVSAFCNAGFSLRPDSLTAWRGDAWVIGTVSALIILGSLGFITVYETVQWSRRGRPLSVHSKLALVVSAALLILGTGLIWFLEGGRSFAGMGLAEQGLAAWFQSVTRTAGFNSVDFAVLSPATLFLMILLMFIGGSPGSCAGGIKTTTFGVLILAMVTRLRGHAHVNLFRRTLGQLTVRNTLTAAVGATIGMIPALFALLLIEGRQQSLTEERLFFLDYLFETVSALATVGLSTGTTPSLSPAGRLLVTLLMFCGRLGPLTLAGALASAQGANDDWRYPEEEVMVG